MDADDLKRVAVLSDLEPEEASSLAAVAQLRTFDKSALLAREGDAAHVVFIITKGEVEPFALHKGEEVAFSHLVTGDAIIEEAALAASATQCSASYKAATDVEALAFPLAHFVATISGNAAALTRLQQFARDAAEARFLRLASPFSALSPLQARKLSERVEAVAWAAGNIILREGELGKQAFLITRGSVDVVLGIDRSDERVIATLREGMMFGEASLLTGEVRNASARARSDVTLLQFDRDDLAEAMKSDPTVARRVAEFLALRTRPQRAVDVEKTTAVSWSGEESVVLKNRASGMSYKLSREGAFLWDRLDGKHTLRDLTLDYLAEFKSFSPMQIAELLGGLAAAGFLTMPPSPDLGLILTPSQRAVLKAREVLTRQVSISGTDRFATALYRWLGWLLHPSMHILYGAVAIIGTIAFGMNFDAIVSRLADAGWLLSLIAFLIAYVPSIVVHEAAHALVAKKYGAEVPRIGYGWNWIAPVAFVDTTDMWRAPLGPRLRTSLAGPYANLVLAGGFSIVAAANNHIASLFLSAAAILGYAMLIFNLLPLLGFDGHHILRDLREAKKTR